MKFLERHQAKKKVRDYFDSQGFVEIDSPILIPANAIEAFIDPILVEGYGELRSSPEIYHKRLLARGYEKIYELGHVFRDETPGRLHLREFTLLEWYRVGACLEDLIQDCESLFDLLAPQVFKTPFEVRSLQDLWWEHVRIDLGEALESDRLVEAVRCAGFSLRDQADSLDAFQQVMGSVIEKAIGQQIPCVVTRWPASMASLSRLCDDDKRFAHRFEIYFNGIELANAFLELTDPVEQRRRFEEEINFRRFLGKSSSKIDENFIQDLKSVPPVAGIAVGFDRLLMSSKGISNIGDLVEI